ncbi:hypothetical protein KCV06_g59, partial [Aureobasidium melanogenum]
LVYSSLACPKSSQLGIPVSISTELFTCAKPTPAVPRRIWSLSPNTANSDSRLTSSVSLRLSSSKPESIVLVYIVRGGRP